SGAQGPRARTHQGRPGGIAQGLALRDGRRPGSDRRRPRQRREMRPLLGVYCRGRPDGRASAALQALRARSGGTFLMLKQLMKLKYLVLLSVTGTIITLDQLTKHIITQRFHPGESVDVVAGIFKLTYVRNPGAAFGLLSRLDAGIRIPF